MTNKEKAREIAEYYTDINDIGVALNSAKEMAEWFKKYLEKKKTEMLDKRRKGEGGVDTYYKRRMVEEIINELFPNTEQDNTDRDE